MGSSPFGETRIAERNSPPSDRLNEHERTPNVAIVASPWRTQHCPFIGSDSASSSRWTSRCRRMRIGCCTRRCPRNRLLVNPPTLFAAPRGAAAGCSAVCSPARASRAGRMSGSGATPRMPIDAPGASPPSPSTSHGYGKLEPRQTASSAKAYVGASRGVARSTQAIRRERVARGAAGSPVRPPLLGEFNQQIESGSDRAGRLSQPALRAVGQRRGFGGCPEEPRVEFKDLFVLSRAGRKIRAQWSASGAPSGANSNEEDR
jgi:hypothetical protein